MLNNRNITIVGFGDSITEAIVGIPDENKRWLNILQEKLSKTFKEYKFQVINSGVGGNSAREAMMRFEKDVVAHKPDFVILEFGGNNEDIAKPERIVNLEEFRTLLNKFKTGLPTETQTIIVTFPPILDDLHVYGINSVFKEHFQKVGGADKSVEPYREITREFAEENDFHVYDFHKELLALGELNGRMNYTMDDGIHLTQEGNMVLAEGVFEKFKEILKFTQIPHKSFK